MTKKSVDAEKQLVVFTFDDGSSETFDMAQVSDEISGRLALHGASQKIGDSYAGAGDAADPLAYAKEAVRDTIAQLYAGDWRVTGPSGPRISDLASAISRLKGMSIEEATKIVDSLSDEQKKLTKKHPQVAATLAVISAERAALRAAKLAESANAAGELSFG